MWDSVDKPGMDKWRSQLDELLKSNAHEVIESNVHDFIETDDPALAAITAICDKIIARGNPTLVDPNWERILLSGPGSEFLRWEEPTDPEVKFCVKEFLLPEGSSYRLLDAAMDLLDLPWNDLSTGKQQRLSADLQKLCSKSEDIFCEGLILALGSRVTGAVQRQPLISDLVEGKIPPELTGNRVDFALQLSRMRWVIEIDGPGHKEEIEKDSLRDRTLRANGWKVSRVCAANVHTDRYSWLRGVWANAESEERRSIEVGTTMRSIAAALEVSLIHRAAWHLLLRPLAVQRCMRGLLMLYRHGALDATRPQRILVVEEDMPVVADAFGLLRDLWESIYSLKPELAVEPPAFSLDVIGGLGQRRADSQVRSVQEPEGVYDVVVSHSMLLGEGYPGALLSQVTPELAHEALRFRRGVGCNIRRSMKWSKEFRYQLDASNESQKIALTRLLKTVFRKQKFRQGQLPSIERLLRGETAIVLLPTGGGKSLIYQFAGILLPGMAIIVDPIISLIDDQVLGLKKMGIDRVEGVSSQTENRDEVLQQMAMGALSYVLIAPERLQIEKFRFELQQLKSNVPISLVVLDEAHCISEWGHDFRPAYLHMPLNLQNYCADEVTGAVPTIVALTGTASLAVLDDIKAELDIKDEETIIWPESFDRQELHFDVRKVSPESRPAELAQVRNMMPKKWGIDSSEFYRSNRRLDTDCGLVFCPHINGKLGVVQVAAGIGHTNYYAGTRPRDFHKDWNQHKRDIQNRFAENEVQELVTTKSFGMGIDKSNIRYTVHYVMPASVEQFYQEAGRAGRNNQEGYALCTVIYSDRGWDQALAILDEQDHSKAMDRLDETRKLGTWGDVLDVHLWFLLNSYRGREKDKEDTFQLWKRFFAGESSSGMRVVNVPFGGDRENREKRLYRLMVLGIVKDYTIDWRTIMFSVTVGNVNIDDVRLSLSTYLKRYGINKSSLIQLGQACELGTSEIVRQAVNIYVDFVYDEIVGRRKQAIRYMAELCRDYRDSENFRSRILAYLQESEFTESLNKWRGRLLEEVKLPSGEVGLEAIRRVLEQSNSNSQMRSLIGTVQRIVEADPNNVALRYLSVGARAANLGVPDRSVIDESGALLGAAQRENIDIDWLRIELLRDVHFWRHHMVGSIAHTMVSGEDGLRFARRLLSVGRKYGDGVRVAALGAVSSNVVETVAGISRFYDLDLAGGQDGARGE